MAKYISIFVITLMGSVVLFFLFGFLFSGGSPVEAVVFTFGAVIVVLLLVLITMMFYLIELIKKRKL